MILKKLLHFHLKSYIIAERYLETASYGEMSELAEGARLEIVYTITVVSGVRIPISPPQFARKPCILCGFRAIFLCFLQAVQYISFDNLKVIITFSETQIHCLICPYEQSVVVLSSPLPVSYHSMISAAMIIIAEQ